MEKRGCIQNLLWIRISRIWWLYEGQRDRGVKDTVTKALEEENILREQKFCFAWSLKCPRNIHVQIRWKAPRESWAISSALQTIFLRGDNEYIKGMILPLLPKSEVGPVACRWKDNNQAKLVERKVYFILDASNWWGSGEGTSVERLTPPSWQPVEQESSQTEGGGYMQK